MLILAFLIGVVAGLRALVAVATASWTARLGGIDVSASWLAFMSYRWTPIAFTVAMLAELVSDKLPNTPSRKVPPQFGARLVTGALAGATFGASTGEWLAGLALGAAGAVVGTFGGAAMRQYLASLFGSDLPAALIEDAIAVIGGLAISMVA